MNLFYLRHLRRRSIIRVSCILFFVLWSFSTSPVEVYSCTRPNTDPVFEPESQKAYFFPTGPPARLLPASLPYSRSTPEHFGFREEAVAPLPLPIVYELGSPK